MKKKLLSMLLALTMVLSLAPAMAIRASAATGTAISAGSFTDGALTLSAGGAYYLSENVTGNITVASGIEVTLDLNGYVLNGSGITTANNKSVVYNQGNLTITDSSIGVKHYFTVGSDGGWILDDSNTEGAVSPSEIVSAPAIGTVFVVEGGCITGGQDGTFYQSGSSKYYCGGGVFSLGGKLTLSGINICGNKLHQINNNSNCWGGGVCFVTSGSQNGLNINNCNISGNVGVLYGMGIFISGGTAVIEDSEICGNVSNYTSQLGGGIYSTADSLSVKNSLINGNKASSGGGIYLRCPTELTDCTIRGNESGRGGGAYVQSNFILTLAGVLEIRDNFATKVGNNMLFHYQEVVDKKLGTTKVYDNGVSDDNALDSRSVIGVATLKPISSTSPKAITASSSKDTSQCYFSDDPMYHTSYSAEDHAVLLAVHTYDDDSYSVSESGIVAVCNKCSHKDTITFTAPEDSMYTGSPIGPEFADNKNSIGAYENLDIFSDNFTYYLTGGAINTTQENSGAESSGKAPVNVGSYVAEFKAGNATLSIPFEITRRSWEELPVITVPKFPIHEYDATTHAITNSAGVTDVKYYFNTTGSNNVGTECTAENMNSLSSGTYYAYGVFPESGNMEGCTTAAVEFYVTHVHNYTYTTVAGVSNTIVATCTGDASGCAEQVREISLTIADATYSGIAYSPEGVEKFIKEVGNAKAVKVTYKKGAETLSSAPVDAGTYEATLTVGDVSVSADFTIHKKLVEKPDVGAQTYQYNKKTISYNLPQSNDYKLVSGSGVAAGSYDVTIGLNDQNNMKWSDGSSDNIVSAGALVITPIKVTRPSESKSTYTYNGGYQVYGYYDGALNYSSPYYTIKDYYRIDAGNQTVTVALADKAGYVWDDDSQDDLQFEFTVNRLKVPKPIGDPRSFYPVSSGTNVYSAFYIVGDCLYSFDGIFYNTENNKRAAAGSQKVKVKPADNMEWDDGSGTAAIEFDFNVQQPQAYGSIYYLYDKEHQEYTDGYIYGNYLLDTQNSRNLYVSTHYEPYVYTYPSGATYQLYYTTDRNNLTDRSKKWSDLTYKSFYCGINQEYVTYYIYAVVHKDGYADYVTNPYTVYVYGPRVNVSASKTYTYTVEETTYKKAGTKLLSPTVPVTKTVTKTGYTEILSRSFARFDAAGAAIIKSLNGGCNYVQTSYLREGTTSVFKPGDQTKVKNAFGVPNNYLYGLMEAPMLLQAEPSLAAILANSTPGAAVLELTEATVEKYLKAGEELRDYELIGDQIGYPDNYVKANIGNSNALPQQIIDTCTSVSHTVTFNKMFTYDTEITDENTIWKKETVSAGSLLVKPADPEFDGMEFGGWYYIPYDEERSSTAVVSIEKDGAAWDFEENRVVGDIVLYALWISPSNQSDGGTTITTYTVTTPASKNGSVTVSLESAAAGSTVSVTVKPDKGYTLETITVLDASGKEVALTIDEIGEKYSFTMPKSAVTVKGTFMEDNTMLNFFVDVKESDYFYDAVLWAAKSGIASGVDSTHFAPNATTTRAQMVTFLWRAAGSPEPTASACKFTDVAADAYYYKAVLWAIEKSITTGVSADRFAPDAVVDRAQAVTFLWRYEDSIEFANMTANGPAPSPFTDVATNVYYYNAVLWAKAEGITSGVTANTFAPNDSCTRAQVVSFLYRDIVK